MYNSSTTAKHFVIFFISSFFSIFAFAYIGFNYNKNKHTTAKDVPFFAMPLLIPTLYGLVGLINYYVIKRFGNDASIIVGVLFGLALSLMGRNVLDLPTKVLNFDKKTEYIIYIAAPVAYAIIFRLAVTPMTNFIIK